MNISHKFIVSLVTHLSRKYQSCPIHELENFLPDKCFSSIKPFFLNTVRIFNLNVTIDNSKHLIIFHKRKKQKNIFIDYKNNTRNKSLFKKKKKRINYFLTNRKKDRQNKINSIRHNNNKKINNKKNNCKNIDHITNKLDKLELKSEHSYERMFRDYMIQRNKLES